MRRALFAHTVLSAVLIAGLSCSTSSRPSRAPAPASAPSPAPGTGAAAGGERVQLTPEQRAARRDSLTAIRGEVVKRLLATIAGHENEPAGQVFKNVELLKEMPAAQFLNVMDNLYGRALSQGCAFCHVPDNWDDDSKGPKKTARLMIQMVNAINGDHLSKLPPLQTGRPPRIGCMTCHRGNQTPGNALMP